MDARHPQSARGGDILTEIIHENGFVWLHIQPSQGDAVDPLVRLHHTLLPGDRDGIEVAGDAALLEEPARVGGGIAQQPDPICCA